MKKIISLLLTLVLLITLVSFSTLNASATNGVQSKINDLVAVYPTGSYFTRSGNAFDDAGCTYPAYDCEDSMSEIPSRGGLPSGRDILNMGIGNGHSCNGFVTYCFGYIFGQNWRTATVVSSPSVGDAVHMKWKSTGGNHYFIYLGEDATYYYIYHSNGDSGTTNKVLYNYALAKSKVSIQKIYHATSYDSVFNSQQTPSPTYSTFAEGMYYIKNNYDGLYLSVNGCKDAQTQNVGTWQLSFPSVNEPVEFQMNFINVNSNGAYKLRPELCVSRVINSYGNTVSSGCNVNIYDDLGETSEWWYFEKVSGGYVIRNVMNTSCAMTVESNQNVIVQTYTGSNNQIWSVQSTVAYDANGGYGAPSMQVKNYDEELILSTTHPTRDGYVFLGWSENPNSTYPAYYAGSSFTYNRNTTLYAVWAPAAYTVTFTDYNGVVLKTETVPYGGSATPPANPTSEGYTFSYWDTPYTNVTTDIVTTAVYATSSYTVTFMDWDNTVISTQTVAYGSAAIAPVPPYHSGCTFIEWDVDYSNITSDLTVTARYYSRIYEVRSQEDFDGRVCILYRVDDENISWRAAKEFCEANGGHLLTVSDENEQADIDSLNIEGVPLWLGASDEDQDGIWEWVTGEPFEYTYWLQGEPNYMDGVEMYLGTFPFEWNDFNEANANIKGFIMEIDSINTEEESCRLIGEVNGDGIVNSLDAAQVLKHDAQLITLAGEGLAAADVNGDGVVNSLDAAQILKFDAQLITEF